MTKTKKNEHNLLFQNRLNWGKVVKKIEREKNKRVWRKELIIKKEEKAEVEEEEK